MPRLFTALEIPRDAALSLSLLRGGLPGARWIDVENYHLTLRFIGDVEAPVADEIANALDRVRRTAFSLTLSGVGAFGSKKPHAVWAGTAPSPDLAALQGEIERICQRIGSPPIRANSCRMSHWRGCAIPAPRTWPAICRPAAIFQPCHSGSGASS